MKRLNKGFTLVELLIVIALIAILSVAVLATINPIEQTNKARDAKFKNDAGEVLGAYERYYAAKTTYPWIADPNGVGQTVVKSTDVAFGIVTAAGTGATGPLIATSELKTSFAQKEPFSASAQLVDIMYAYSNGSDGNFVCFIPKARANRTNYGELRCLGSADDPSAMLKPGDVGCQALIETSTAWNTSGSGNPVTDYYMSGYAQFICVPDSGITADVTPVDH